MNTALPFRALLLFLAGTLVLAPRPSHAQMTEYAAPMSPSDQSAFHGISFERPALDFASQGIGQENCVNIPLNNYTDRARLLTSLISLDPQHFQIMSPAATMLPVTVQPQGSVIISVCFSSSTSKAYRSKIIARLNSDSAVLAVQGSMLKEGDAGWIPKAAGLNVVPCGKRQYTFKVDLIGRSTISLIVENALGKAVRQYQVNDMKTAGVYRWDFDGKDDAGAKLPGGKYYVRLESRDVETKKVDKFARTLTLK